MRFVLRPAVFFCATVLASILSSAISLAQPRQLAEEHLAIFDLLDQHLTEVSQQLQAQITTVEQLAPQFNTPEEAYVWVKHNTSLSAYRGLLKNADGVLREGRGNSLDRSLLLAALLKEQKLKVRIAKTEVDDNHQRQLFALTVANPPKEFQPLNSDFNGRLESHKNPQNRELLNQLITRYNQSLSESHRSTEQSWLIAESLLLNLSERLGQKSDAANAQLVMREKSLQMAQLKSHFWLQVQSEGGWRNFDLTMEKPDATRSIQFDYLTVDEAEKSFSPPIRILLEITDFDGKTTQTNIVFDRSFSVSELDQKAIRLVHRPLQSIDESEVSDFFLDAARAQALTEKYPIWLPILKIGEENFFDNHFSINGDVSKAEMSDLLQSLGSDSIIGKNVREKVESGIKLFPDSSEKEEQKAALKTGANRQVIRETLIIEYADASGNLQRVKRVVFDFEEKSISDKQALAHARMQELFSKLRLDIDTVRVSELESTLNLSLAAQSFNRSLLADLQGKTIKEADILRFNSDDSDLNLLATSRWIFSEQGSQLFIAEPQILIVWERYFSDKDQMMVRTETDWVNNRLAAYLVVGTDLFTARLRQGIVDTVAEAALLSRDKAFHNAALDHYRAIEKKQDWRSLTSANQVKGLTNYTETLLTQALQNNFILIGPKSVDQPEDMTWWQVDPHSGHTLGFGYRGTGSSSVEQALLIYNVAMCMKGAFDAMSHSSQSARMIGAISLPFCLAGAAVGAAGNLGGMGASQAAAVTGAIDVYTDMLDIAADMADATEGR